MNSLITILQNKKYRAPAFVFTSLNIAYGTWAIYIPFIKDKLALSKSELGIAIFFLALGNLTILSFAPRIIRYYGSGYATKYAALILSATTILPFLAFNQLSLMLALFIQGAAQGLLDIAMNNLVTLIEKRDKIKLMSSMHGFFSLGGVFAGMGIVLLNWIVNPLLHVGLLAISVFAINLLLSDSYSKIESEDKQRSPIDLSYLKALFWLGLISFVAMGSEGAIVDWSGLYLREINLAPEHLLGAGFLGFSIAMTTGRFLGDGISERLGSKAILILGSLVASIGYLLVLSNILTLTIIGFVLIGLGFSVIVPELFRTTAHLSTINTAKALAIVAGCGYSGFLIGPVVLGFTAEHFGLETSFIGLLSACLLILCISIYQLIKK